MPRIKDNTFTKVCLADALIELLKATNIEDITINQICDKAGINRSTWFRNFDTKEDAIAFKLYNEWLIFGERNKVLNRPRYHVNDGPMFFIYTFENKELYKLIYQAGMTEAIFKTFYKIIMPQYEKGKNDEYVGKFYSYGWFGILDEWIKRDFKESPEEVSNLFLRVTGVLKRDE